LNSKKLKSYSLLLLYIIVAFNYIIPVLSHHIFKEYIINEVCVQREVIENKCQGNCHLQTQLTESEEEKLPIKSNVRYQTQNDFVNIIPQIASLIIIEKQEIIYFSIDNKLLENFKSPIIPPPKNNI